MSNNQTVDQRIVEMRFDNADFENRVANTLNSLSKLRESAKMEDAGKGMDNLAKGVRNVDVASLAASVEALSSRFSNLGIVGMTVLQRLTNAAMDFGHQVVNAITMAPKDGWKEFELNTDSIKTILNSAKDANGLPVTLDMVNEKLNELNAYSDKTIYSFSDMTSNIGKFTNAGVDLESAVTAIQGVANVAALAGANANDASRAMYNFGQALGSGSVKLIDWKSIENANMATVDFKEQLIQTAEELGTLRKEGDKYVSTTTDMSGKISDAFTATQGFNDSLSAQWMTADVLTKTLAKYTDENTALGQSAIEAATKVNTFSKLIDTLKESMGSGWMQSWQYIFGDYNEATELWTGVYREVDAVIQKVAELRNNALKAWKEMGGRDDLIKGFANLWRTAKAFVEPIGELFQKLIPPVVPKTMAGISHGFKEFTDLIAPPVNKAAELAKKVGEVKYEVEQVSDRAEKFNEIVQQIIRGDWGDGQERIDRLHEAGYAFENLQNAVNELLGCEKRYETVMSDNEAVGEKNAETIEAQAAAQTMFASSLGKSNVQIVKHSSIVENLAYIVMGVTSAAKLAVAVVSKAVDKFKELSGGIHPVAAFFGIILDALGSVGMYMYKFNTWVIQFSSFTEAIEGIKAKIVELIAGVTAFGDNALNLDPIINLLDKIKAGYEKIRDAVVETTNKIKDFAKTDGINTINKVFTTLGTIVGGALLIAFNTLATAITKIVDNAQRLKTAISELAVVQYISGKFEDAKTKLIDFWKAMTSGAEGSGVDFAAIIQQVSSTIDTISSVIGGTFQVVFKWFLAALKSLDSLARQAFDAFKKSGLVEEASDTLDKFKQVLKDLPTIVDNFFKSIKQGKLPSLGEMSQSLADFVASARLFGSELRDNVSAWIRDFFKNLGETISGFANIDPSTKFGQFVQSIKEYFALFKSTTTDAGSTVQDFISNVVEKIKSIDFRGGAITALIATIAAFVFRWSRVGKNASKALNSLSTFLKNGGKAAVTAKEKFDGFLKIGAAVALIAGAIWLLAQIPADQFLKCAITVGVAFAALFGAVVLLSKMNVEDDKLKGIGIAFLGISASLLLVGAAIKTFGELMKDPVGFTKGVIAIIGAIVILVAGIKSVGEVDDGVGAAFAGLAAGVLMLAVAVRVLAKMKVSTLIKGGWAVGVFVFAMAAAMKIAGEAKGEGFVGLAASILILIPAIKAFASMKFTTLIKGGAAVLTFMFSMAAASRIAGESDGSAFKAMSAAIRTLSVAIFILAKLPLHKVLGVSLSLSAVFLALSVSMNTMKNLKWQEIGKMAVAMVATLGIVTAALLILTNVGNPDAILPVALGMSAIMFSFAAMAPAIAIMSAIPFPAAVAAAGEMLVFIGALALALGALGEIDQYFGENNPIIRGAEVIGSAIHHFVEALIFDNTGEAADGANVLSSIAETLSGFGDKIAGFIDSLMNIDPSVGENAKNIAVAILALTAAELIDALTSFATGKSTFDTFGDAVESMAEAMSKISAVATDETFDSRKVKSLVTAVKGLVEVANALPKQGGWAQDIMGHQDLGEFAAQLADFMNNGFRTFLAALNLLGDLINGEMVVKCALIKSGVKSMIDISTVIPKQHGLAQLFTGKSDLGEFATQLAKFMNNGYKDFVTAVNAVPDVDEGKISGNIVPATKDMIELAKEIKMNNKVVEFFTGSSDLSVFGTRLAEFGKGIGEYYNSVVNLEADKISGITTCMQDLADLNASEKLATSNLGTFASSINTLGSSLNTFTTDTSGVSPANLSSIITSITNLHNLLLIIAATDYSQTSGFTDALTSLATSGIEGFTEAFAESADKAASAVNLLMGYIMSAFSGHVSEYVEKGSTAVQAYLNGIATGSLLKSRNAVRIAISYVIGAIENNLDEFYKKGKKSVLEFCRGIEDNSGFLDGAGKSLVTHAISGIDTDLHKFYDRGEDAADGFRKGINDNAQAAADAAYDMVRDAIRAAANAQDSASPSKEFAKLGKDGVWGYALGWEKNSGMALRSVRETGKDTIFAMMGVIANMKQMIEDGVDDSLTIRPVMDLSNISRGVAYTNSMLSNIGAVTTDVNAAVSIANAHNEELARQQQRIASYNYSKDLTSLNENMNKLISAVRQNRYAIIDGEYVFDYVDRRMGMAY